MDALAPCMLVPEVEQLAARRLHDPEAVAGARAAEVVDALEDVRDPLDLRDRDAGRVHHEREALAGTDLATGDDQVELASRRQALRRTGLVEAGRHLGAEERSLRTRSGLRARNDRGVGRRRAGGGARRHESRLERLELLGLGLLAGVHGRAGAGRVVLLRRAGDVEQARERRDGEEGGHGDPPGRVRSSAVTERGSVLACGQQAREHADREQRDREDCVQRERPRRARIARATSGPRFAHGLVPLRPLGGGRELGIGLRIQAPLLPSGPARVSRFAGRTPATRECSIPLPRSLLPVSGPGGCVQGVWPLRSRGGPTGPAARYWVAFARALRTCQQKNTLTA